MSEETTQPQITLGQMLIKARLAKNLTIETIGAHLKLTPVQIEKIEADDYLTLGPETFVRGYIKGYCRLVELNADSVLALYEGHTAPERSRRMKSFSRRTEKEAHDNRLMWVSYLILALVIGSSIFWWWQTTSTQKDVTLLPAPTVELVEAEGQMQEATTEAGDSLIDQSADLNLNEAGSDETGNSLSIVDAQDPSADTQQVAEATPVVQSLESSRPQNSSIERPVLSTIVMQFGEDSWVEIFDATSERVAFGIKKSGYTMTVAGKAPFSVVLAKHQKVSVSLDGEPVDLSYLPKNKLAKFKLPLAE